jgi:aminopeptidase 2
MDALKKKSGEGIGMAGLAMHVTTKTLSTADYFKDVKDIFAKRDTSRYDQKLAQILDGIKARAAWVERDGLDVEGWLREKGYDDEVYYARGPPVHRALLLIYFT